MSALQVLIDGFLTAAELVALLFVSPASAAEPPQHAPTVQVAASANNARSLQLLSSSFDVRLLGSLADVRVSQQFRNDSGDTVNLAARLPAVDEHTDALRIHRSGRIVDLLGVDPGCGNEENDEAEPLQAHAAGHAQISIDEVIADALQLAPGETASIEWIATQALARTGATYRLALPAHAVVEAQALLVDQSDARFLVVVPHRAARGIARLTLRPDRGATEIIELGQMSAALTAYVVPLADSAAVKALASGAIELETRADDGIVWSTLPTHVRPDASLALARTSK